MTCTLPGVCQAASSWCLRQHGAHYQPGPAKFNMLSCCTSPYDERQERLPALPDKHMAQHVCAHLLQIRPLEEAYKFGHFFSSLLNESDFEARPSVLLLGQYSTGKTTFIKHLLGRDYPGIHIGPEPTTGTR